MTTKKLEVSTPNGILAVETYDDPSYPGFTLLLNGKQCGVFEYDSVDKVVKLHAWSNAGDEDDPDITVDVRLLQEDL